MPPPDEDREHAVQLTQVWRAYWPLAASWAFMAAELPLLAAVVARLPEPEIHLAAYGGAVFPLALLVEAPVIMLLAASTALSKDRASYVALRRFMHRTSAVLTALHVALAFTPLFDLLVVRALDIPAPVVEPARIGLRIMTPWTWAIGYRRFQQGALIRWGYSRSVGMGTAVRLGAVVTVLLVGRLFPQPSGIVVATTAVILGVLAEAAFARWRAQVLLPPVLDRAPAQEPLRGREFARFYVPLAMTPLITLVVQPIGAGAMSRMPLAIESLAVWPVLHGITFLLQSFGLAFSEVVVAFLGRPGAVPALRRFTAIVATALLAVMTLLAATPLSNLYFAGFSGLPPEMTRLAVAALWIAIPLPALRVLVSWYQGALVYTHETAGITESVVVFLAVCVGVLVAGVHFGEVPGILVGFAAFLLARIAETAWVWLRFRRVRGAIGA